MTVVKAFHKLLVANRGEIAVRVMRTAREMGLRTVAVYSEADHDSAHVHLADQAVCIGPAASAQSYLRVEAIIEAARRTGADAVHPGYGFLAENPALPRACAEAGLVFVGPSAEAMTVMGDKARAKARMMEAEVPCVPGFEGEDQSEAALFAAAQEIGFPVMIKATAGGGGRGMRLVQAADGFAQELASAKSEARGAFGSDTVLLEKAILRPRHVEIQIMADTHGNVIHLGERDCSVQRRHQKVIEEAPSPAVDAALRARMGQASVRAAQAIGYVGAGTFEYLLDEAGAFYFMEMNTRLQVEHPVTEAITGLDLVALQLQVAGGAVLPLAQADVQFQGHAIEVRLCAEDPVAGFMPQAGVVTEWAPADFLRVDHALRAGAEVPPYYDSMVAKLVAHGATREDARRQLLAGLEQSVVMGLRTNKDFLADCLAHPGFADGTATTAFVGAYGDSLLAADPEAQARAAMVAAVLMRAGPGNRLTHGYPTPMRLARGEEVYPVMVQAFRDGLCRAELEGQAPVELRVRSVAGGRYSVEWDGVADTLACVVDSAAGTVTVQLEGRCFDFVDLTFQPVVAAGPAGGDGKVRATMNGSVVSVDIAVGDRVEAGQALVVVEAMKMEHVHASPVAGVVEAVHVAAGQQVSPHAVLVEILPDG